MRIAILGTRGIPNYYGGFEQFAEHLSLGLTKLGHEVSVYSSHDHPYQSETWNKVTLIHKKNPEARVGAIGQFFYDLYCVLDTRKREFDIVLQLGYTSSAIWNFLFPKNTLVITNMDGLEWKRTKYSFLVQLFLRFSEYLAILFSHKLISDSKGIQSYLLKKYNVESDFIPYGASVFDSPEKSVLEEYNLEISGYDMLVARLEPENNIEMILDGFINSNVNRKFLVIGSTKTKLGQRLIAKYNDDRIIFLGYVNDIKALNSIRYHSNLYFHGHSVGGTNPSLLEAMASNSLVCAHDNIFNREVLGDDALYFQNLKDVKNLIETTSKSDFKDCINRNINKIIEIYNSDSIIKQYELCCINSLIKE